MDQGQDVFYRGNTLALLRPINRKQKRKHCCFGEVESYRIASDVLFAALVWREDPVARAQTNCVGCEGLPWKASKILS
jgi:hypothetical protein